MSNEITVYWAPAAFTNDETSWHMLYREPEPVLKHYLSIKDERDMQEGKAFGGSTIFACPATNDLLNNLFVVKSNLKEHFVISEHLLKEVNNKFVGNPFYLDGLKNNVGLQVIRRSPYAGYTSLSYNIKYIFFAEESVNVRFTAPYYPAFSPIDGAILTSGCFDIGQWFRPFNMEFLIPNNSSKEFKINVDDPYFYMEFMTDKKINFKRFFHTEEINSIVREFVEAPSKYGRRIPLYKRYEMAKQTKILEVVLSKIKNNLVD